MKKLSIVFQTHWDREWYLNVDEYNFRLKKVINRILNLLDNDEISCFVFDGQVKALEDYLSICEVEDKKRIMNHLHNNRIIIGPWFVLSDEFLVSGESLVRNLEIGINKAKTYSKSQQVGYLPDTFGHISQMPQILSQFQLTNTVLWRGVVPKDKFFNWEAPDGSSIFAVYLKEGYYQPIIDQENYSQLLESYLSKMDNFSDHKHHLLTNGGDHLMPAMTNIRERINLIQKEHNIDVEVTSYEKYIKRIKNKESYQRITGELRSNDGIYVLPNVLSSRYNLKKHNQQIEDKVKLVESMLINANPHFKSKHERQMEAIWEMILLNHPHDSICGCSIDEVHLEMEVRSLKINKQLDQIIKDCFIELGAYNETTNYVQKNSTKIFDDYSKFTLYNPTLRYMSDFVRIRIFLNGASSLVDNFVVTDESTTYTTIILSKEEGREFESPLDSAPQFRTGYYYDVVFRAKEFRGLSTKNYTLRKGQPIILSKVNDTFIENDKLVVSVENDSLKVTVKASNNVYNGINQYISSLDAGDEYNYSMPVDDIVSKAKLKKVYSRKHTYYQELHLEHEMKLPKGLKDDRSSGLETKVQNIIKTVVRLFHNSNQLEFNVKYNNKAENQRTRVMFDLNKKIEKHYSDTAFDLVERQVRDERYEAPKQKEVPVVVDPSLSTIVCENGFIMNHIGMQEYQMINQNDTTHLAVTMLRSVGQISRDDLRSRGGGAGPSLYTPDAQMIGEYEYKYSLQFESKMTNNDLFRLPILVSKGHAKNTGSLLEIDNEKIQVSSFRRKGDFLELRLFNPTSKSLDFNLKSRYALQEIMVVDLAGNRQDKDIYYIAPREIKTIRFSFKEEETIYTDVLVCGGSIGGVQASIKLLEQGYNVILTEETPWIGGQLTNQAVPLDEHPFIEEFGCSLSYRRFRDTVRNYYKTNYNVVEQHKNNTKFNPGNAWVTRLAFEPKVAFKILLDQLKKYKTNLTLLTNTKAVSSESDNHYVECIVLEDVKTLERKAIQAKYYIDGTDLGDLLPITNTAYTTGSEGKENTKEFHATKDRDPEDMQPVTHVVAMKWNDVNPIKMEKPKYYEYFKSLKTPYSDKMVISEYGPDSTTHKERKFNVKEGRMPLWTYRRFFDPNQFIDSGRPEMTTVNWPQNDYFLGNIIDSEFSDVHKKMAKELTKSFVYYLQNEVPRHDGGYGYHEMEIAKECLGTDDGFAMAPYVRESRRIKAIKTIVENDVSGRCNPTLPHVDDSVGVGCYHIDLHITTKSNRFLYDNTWPFEIPLGAFIPVHKKNVLPACKNIGTTHLTNGCFRLHPVEWNIGEVTGLFVSYLIKNSLSPQDCYKEKSHIKAFQKLVVQNGIEISWPEDKVHII